MKHKIFILCLILMVSMSSTVYGNQVWPLIMDNVTYAANEQYVTADFRADNVSNFFYIWSGGNDTYVQGNCSSDNFYGNSEGYRALTVGSEGWAGAGLTLTADGTSWQDAETLRQVIVANPENYYLHIAIKSTDSYSHCFYTFGNEATKFVLGSKNIYDGTVYQDFVRDGSWHEFYIPMSRFSGVLVNQTCVAGVILFGVLSEGVQGAELNLDAVYICDEEYMNNQESLLHKCGDNLTWELNNGQLVIEGYGAMYDFEPSYYAGSSREVPWGSYIDSITSITLPGGLTHIGQRAFEGCKITSVSIPSSVNSIGSAAFSSTNLITVSIPGTVDSIESYAFGHCDYMTNAIVNNGVTHLGYEVFADNRSLQTLQLPNTLVNTNRQCYGMSSLHELTCPATVLNFYSRDTATHRLQTVTINGGELDESGFAFINQSYKTLQSLDLGSATNTTLADEAIKGCYNLQSLVLPTNLEAINYMAVASCTRLESITISAGVSSIGDRAFEDCRSLNNVLFAGNNVTSIGAWAFYNCHALQSLNIPEGVTEIGDGAFYGCTYLTNISLPTTMQQMRDNSFALCHQLQEMTVNASVPPVIQARTFYNVSRSIPVYVPAGSEGSYTSDPYWSEFLIRTAPSGIEEILADSEGKKDGKIIVDGNLYILRNGKAYTVMGQEVR